VDSKVAIHAFEDFAIDVGLRVAISRRSNAGAARRVARREAQQQQRQDSVGHFLKFVEQVFDPLELLREFHLPLIGAGASEAAMLLELDNLPGHDDTRL
jgi:hypothetical protein